MAEKIVLPLSPDKARKLRMGDIVYADGEAIVTAGLPTHVRLLDAILKDDPLPIRLDGWARSLSRSTPMATAFTTTSPIQRSRAFRIS
jgi:tartrate dehydratase beta subunit/fumarate hydratase class I family protein